MSSIVKVAFPLISSQAWMGGYNYLLSLISALKKHEASRVEPILFCGKDTSADDLAPFQKIEGLQIITHQAFSAESQTKGLLQAVLLGKNKQIANVFNKTRVDVVFEPAHFYGWRLKQSSIAWFPDFQHRHMRDLFSRASWLKRELGFKMQIWAGRTILLSSQNAKKDCVKFYSIDDTRMVVLTFPTVIPEYLLDVDFASFKTRYDLPEKFVYVPNQFWTHKNHGVLVDALALLKNQGVNVTIICTGNTKDPRNADYFSLLEKKVSQLELQDNFCILGLIPREHAVGLLRACTLLINPSFFEGWNTSVEEAKAFNVPMLLSNIEVHQEQATDKAHYFDPNSAEALAALLKDQIDKTPAPTNLRGLNQNSEKAIKNFASAFVDITLTSANSDIIHH